MATEKEKMLSGQKYDACYDEDLLRERVQCKKSCFEYNNLSPDKSEERKKLIHSILGKTGKNILIEQPFMCDYGYNIEVGENFYSNHNLIILDAAKVSFGSNVFIGPNCAFYTAIHPIEAEERNTGVERAEAITVGDNVWFGGNVVVLPGVNIGSNTVIGAGSVVVKDIPDNVVAVGNPCKIIRQI